MAKSDSGIRRKSERIRNNKYSEVSVREAYAKYKTGAITRNDYSMFLYEFLRRYINEELRHFCVGADDIEDLQHEVFIVILKDMESYDPFQTKPSVYFGTRIRGAVRKHLGDNHCSSDLVSPYLKEEIRKTKKILAAKGRDASNIGQYSTNFLVQITGKSVVTVKMMKEAENRQLSQIEENPEFDMEGHVGPSPEEYVLQKELNEMLTKVLLRISPAECCAVLKKFVDDVTAKDIASYLNMNRDHYDVSVRKISPLIVQNLALDGLSKIRLEMMLEDYIEDSHTERVAAAMDEDDDDILNDLESSMNLDISLKNRNKNEPEGMEDIEDDDDSFDDDDED